MKIGLVNLLIHSNLAWHMHKRYNPKATGRRGVIMQYIKRNKKHFDDQAKGVVKNIGKCAAHNQMKAYDHWYFLVFGELADDKLSIPPSKGFINDVENNYEKRIQGSDKRSA